MATLVHPNLKHFHMCPHLKERAVFLLKQEMLKRQEGVPSTCTSATTNSPIVSSSTSCSSSSTLISTANSSSARKNLLMEIFDKQSAIPEKSSVEEELEKYLTSTSVVQDEEKDDILSYWREHQKLFPLIASIARDVLAIPASNTSVERLFSSCKNTVTDKRTRLGAEKLNKLMFLQKNRNILKEKCPATFTETNNDHDTKRKYDTTILNNQSIQKKSKLHDLVINQQNDNDYLVHIESEDDEQTF